jgi:hypothetical protein
MTIQFIKRISIFLLLLITPAKGEPIKVKLTEVIGHQSKYITLKNKLKVYLISNPKTKVSSEAVLEFIVDAFILLRHRQEERNNISDRFGNTQ